jgi:hypothetical protein
VPLVIFSHPHVGSIAFHFVVPGVHGGVSSNAVLLIIAIVGTTVAPWQLFFQQSNVIDKRITPRFIRYERADTILGSLVVVVSAAVILIATVYAVAGTSRAGHFMDALGVANAFGAKSSFLGAVFALVLLDASIIGAAAVTLSTSYAFGDVFNLTHSLHRKFRDAKAFYASYTLVVVLAAGIVLIPGAPLGLLTTAVQSLAGVLLPSASVFLLLLCNASEVLGPWTNARWLNSIAGVIIGLLLTLSGTLVVTTLFPGLSAPESPRVDRVHPGGRLSAGVWLAPLRRCPASRPPSRPASRAPSRPLSHPPAGPGQSGLRRYDAGRAGKVADAAASAAQAGGLVASDEDHDHRHVGLPRHLRSPANRQGCPARGGVGTNSPGPVLPLWVVTCQAWRPGPN